MKNLMRYIHSTFNYMIDIDARQFAENARLSLLTKSVYNVYVNPVTIPGYEDNYEHYCKLTQNALNEWSAVIDNKIKFHVQSSIMGADIKLYWRKCKRCFAAKQYREAISWDSNGNPLYTMLAVNIGIMDMENNPFSDKEIYHLILHEFGHILTLGHSPDPHDVMCGGGDWNPYLTEKDKFVLKLIYSFENCSTYQECLPEIEKRVKDFMDSEEKKKKAQEEQNVSNPAKLKKYIPEDLLNNLECIEDIVKYKMALQGVALNDETSKYFTKPEYLLMNPEEVS